MKVLVTDASGFIGSHFISRISKRHEIFALMRNPPKNPTCENVSTIKVDLAQPLDHTVLPAGIDMIIHLAQANVFFPAAANEFFAVNTSATQQLLNYGRLASAKRFLLASSGDVYGRRTGFCKETDSLAPIDFY